MILILKKSRRGRGSRGIFGEGQSTDIFRGGGGAVKKHPVVSHLNFDTSQLSDKIAIMILSESFPPGHLPAGAPPPPAEYLYID